MSLANRNPRRRQRGDLCSVAKLYERLGPDDADRLRGWFADDDVETKAIYRELVDAELWDRSDFPIGRHRRGECQCGAL